MRCVSVSSTVIDPYLILLNTALVSRHPIYDLMRDYLTLSWARFSKDVQSHTLQISKILAHPAPRAGELIKLDASLIPLAGRSLGAASGSNNNEDTCLEVIARFPGGLDFGRGLVDINFTMWPLFKCLNIDNVLTICEVCIVQSLPFGACIHPEITLPKIALAPTGRVLFFSRYPAMLGVSDLFFFLSTGNLIATDCRVYHQISRGVAWLERHCPACRPCT